jgi:membrane-bound serine protease (ClpP class)
MVVTVAALFFYIGFYVLRSQRKKVSTGAEDMIGKVGEARSEINAQGGRVFVRGEIWIASCEGVIPAGAKVEVVRLEGLKVFVKKAD